jgi:hypothetical protein
MPLICISLIALFALVWIIGLMKANKRDVLYHCPKCHCYHTGDKNSWLTKPEGFDDLIRWQFCYDCQEEYLNNLGKRK